MVHIDTRKFGTLEIEEDKVISFPSGLPGFPEHIRYTLLSKDETHPFCWLQSVDDPDLAMIVIDPFVFKPDYRIDFQEIIEKMRWNGVEEKELMVFVVVTFSEDDSQKITANLMGPMIINAEKHEAIQVVLQNNLYSIHHDIFEKEK